MADVKGTGQQIAHDMDATACFVSCANNDEDCSGRSSALLGTETADDLSRQQVAAVKDLCRSMGGAAAGLLLPHGSIEARSEVRTTATMHFCDMPGAANVVFILAKGWPAVSRMKDVQTLFDGDDTWATHCSTAYVRAQPC